MSARHLAFARALQRQPRSGGARVETGVNWNQVGLYSLDTAITGTTIAGVGLGIYVFGGD